MPAPSTKSQLAGFKSVCQSRAYYKLKLNRDGGSIGRCKEVREKKEENLKPFQRQQVKQAENYLKRQDISKISILPKNDFRPTENNLAETTHSPHESDWNKAVSAYGRQDEDLKCSSKILKKNEKCKKANRNGHSSRTEKFNRSQTSENAEVQESKLLSNNDAYIDMADKFNDQFDGTPSTSKESTTELSKKAHRTKGTSVGKCPRDFTKPENVKHLSKKCQENAMRLSYMTRSVVKRMREEAFQRGEISWAADEAGKRRRLADELSTSSEESVDSETSTEERTETLADFDPTNYRPTPSMVITSTENHTPSSQFGFHLLKEPRTCTSVGKKPRDFTKKKNMRHLKISAEDKTTLQCVTRAMLTKRKQLEECVEDKNE